MKGLGGLVALAELDLSLTHVAGPMIGLRGLVALTGLASGARVLIFAETQADWLVTALACWRQGATVVTAYATLGEEGVSSAGNQTGAAVCYAPNFQTSAAPVWRGGSHAKKPSPA